MNIIQTAIPDVVIIEPKVFGDSRGYFSETYKADIFLSKVCNTTFVQDNESKSKYGVLRGLHYQLPPFAQSKLVRVIIGKVLDVAVDIRKGSPTFGKYVAIELSDENKRQLFVPRGFAHGFVVLSDEAIFQYKVDNTYSPQSESSIRFDSLDIDWMVAAKDLLLSDKDKQAPAFEEAKYFDYAEKLY